MHRPLRWPTDMIPVDRNNYNDRAYTLNWQLERPHSPAYRARGWVRLTYGKVWHRWERTPADEWSGAPAGKTLCNKTVGRAPEGYPVDFAPSPGRGQTCGTCARYAWKHRRT